MIHAPAATKKNKVDKKRAKVSYASWNQRQGEGYIRGERDSIVDGYQAVEHERCLVRGESIVSCREQIMASQYVPMSWQRASISASS